jgi:hypothetical protein
VNTFGSLVHGAVVPPSDQSRASSGASSTTLHSCDVVQSSPCQVQSSPTTVASSTTWPSTTTVAVVPSGNPAAHTDRESHEADAYASVGSEAAAGATVPARPAASRVDSDPATSFFTAGSSRTWERPEAAARREN